MLARLNAYSMFGQTVDTEILHTFVGMPFKHIFLAISHMCMTARGKTISNTRQKRKIETVRLILMLSGKFKFMDSEKLLVKLKRARLHFHT